MQILVDVTNVGGTEGSEIVQLYISTGKSNVFRPSIELQAFDKVHDVKPGLLKTAQFVIDKYSVSYYDDLEDAWIAEKGEYVVKIGASVEDIRLEQVFTVQDTFTWVGV